MARKRKSSNAPPLRKDTKCGHVQGPWRCLAERHPALEPWLQTLESKIPNWWDAVPVLNHVILERMESGTTCDSSEYATDPCSPLEAVDIEKVLQKVGDSTSTSYLVYQTRSGSAEKIKNMGLRQDEHQLIIPPFGAKESEAPTSRSTREIPSPDTGWSDEIEDPISCIMITPKKNNNRDYNADNGLDGYQADGKSGLAVTLPLSKHTEDLGPFFSLAEHAVNMNPIKFCTYEEFNAQIKNDDNDDEHEKVAVMQGSFADSGMYTAKGLIDYLVSHCPRQTLDIQNPRGHEEMSGLEFAQVLKNDEPEYNALSLGNICRADEPLFTREPRFCLLEALIRRVTEGPEQTCALAHLRWNLVGLKGSRSGAHLDALAGTWIRVLFGTKIWKVVLADGASAIPPLDKANLDDFVAQGSEWTLPVNLSEEVELQPDSILVMLPGDRVIHTAGSKETCAIQGGFFWDFFRVPQILDALIFNWDNQTTTNEPVFQLLPKMLDELEAWIDKDTGRFARGDHDAFRSKIKPKMEVLRRMGCTTKDCGKKCAGSTCPCIRKKRSCTDWCESHGKRVFCRRDPMLPP